MKLNVDRQIWHDFKEGKDEALSYIYDHNIDFLFYYGKKFITDEAIILDTIQDMFCSLIEKRQNLGVANNIRMYLLKSFRRRLFIEIDKINKKTLETEIVAQPIITFSIEEELIKDEERSKKQNEIQKAVKKLNSKQREVLYYKYNSGFDYEEICEIMGISYSSARQLVSRAVVTLRIHMKEKGLFFLFFIQKNKI